MLQSSFQSAWIEETRESKGGERRYGTGRTVERADDALHASSHDVATGFERIFGPDDEKTWYVKAKLANAQSGRLISGDVGIRALCMPIS